jgi:hypothetical protein
VDLITPDQLIPQPRELVLRSGTPETIAGWKALADGLLTDQPCVFHRNLEISSRYAWMYKFLPACFKWAGMAAFASHHVRLALFPFRLDRDRAGYVDIPHSLGRRKVLLMADVNTIRETNNAIFDDIFWVHLAYGATDDGIERLRALLATEPHYAAVLSHRRDPAGAACAGVAEDHPLRRSLALDRDVHRSALPAIRRPHALGRRQSVPHLRRSARLRVEPLCPGAFTAVEPGLGFSRFGAAIRTCPPRFAGRP